METKEIEIQWKGEPKKVKIKKMSFHEKNEVQDAAVKIQMVGRNKSLRG